MPDVTPVKALYTPHIQFGSIGWLRAALLYWEGILRFVPEGSATFDPPEVHELVAAGLIENVSPSRYRRAAAELFDARFDEVLSASRQAPCLNANADPLVHVSQIERELLARLERRGLATSGGEWAKMSPEMATLYRAILGNTAGRELNAAPTTDETACDASIYFEYRKRARGPAPSAPADGFACVRVIEPFPSIEKTSMLTTETLLKVRASTSAQRRMFRDTVQARIARIADLPSAEAIVSHLQDFETEVEGEVHVQRGVLVASNLRDAWRLLLISAPASIGTAVAVAGSVPLIAALGVIGSIGLGIADVMMHVHQRKRAGHYLLVLEAAVGRRRGLSLREPRAAQNVSTAGRTSSS